MAIAGTGFLSTVAAKIREYVDEPEETTKFSDARIIDQIRRAYQDILDDVNRVSEHKIRARIVVAIVPDQRYYVLPPSIGQFLEFKKLDGDGNILWEMMPAHPLSPLGPGFTIESGFLRLDPSWKQNESMEIWYVPSAEAPIFEVNAATTYVSDSAAPTNTVITLPAAIAGTIDQRPLAYVGYVFRALTASVQQERIITESQATDITIEPQALNFGASPFTFAWEVVPQMAYRYQDLIALKVSRFFCDITGDQRRSQLLQAEYQDAMRALRLQASNFQQRTGKRFQRVLRFRRTPGKTH